MDVFGRRDGEAFKFLRLELDETAGVNAPPGRAYVLA
jgi:hypothetical protein